MLMMIMMTTMIKRKRMIKWGHWLMGMSIELTIKILKRGLFRNKLVKIKMYCHYQK